METKNIRPWGYYQVLSDEPDHKVKRIVVVPGGSLSLQRHSRRSGTLVCGSRKGDGHHRRQGLPSFERAGNECPHREQCIV